MRPFVLAVTTALALAASPATARDRVRGDGQLTTQPRDLGEAFDEIELDGGIDARVRVGPAHAVSVTIDSNLQRHVRLYVERRTLRVDTDADLDHRGEAYVTVTLPALRALSTRGSGDAVVEGGQGDLALATGGSGDIRWSGEAGTLSVSTSGSGDARLSGKADALDARTSGSGDLHARELTVRDANVQTSGTGDAELTLAGGTLSARTSGTGDVTWDGDASNVVTQESGTGDVRSRAR
jgi:hypothetical protein